MRRKIQAMIKNLLNADEEPPEGTKVVIEDSIVNVPAQAQDNLTETTDVDSQRPAVFEIPSDAQFFVKSAANEEEKAEFEQFSSTFDDIEKQESAIIPTPQVADETAKDDIRAEFASEIVPAEYKHSELLSHIEKEEPEIFSDPEKFLKEDLIETDAQKTEEPKTDYAPTSGTLFQEDYTPPSTGETIRNSGLAWSAGIVLFGSVIFMMIFGWFADLLLGSSPWGLVGGVILGGMIGIFQLFRISSQIYKK